LASGVLLLALLALPVMGVRLATADAGNDAPGTTTRAAYDLIALSFGPGTNGPLVVVADRASLDDVQALEQRLRSTPGVAGVEQARWSDDRTVAAITVVPTSAPQTRATEDLVGRLRRDVIPASGVTAHVGGVTASDIDFAAVLRGRLLLFIGAVLTCSFLL